MTQHRDYLLGASLPLIRCQTAAEYGVSVRAMCGPSRKTLLVYARRAFALRAHEAGASLHEIGRMIDRHHTTVLHHLRTAKAEQERIAS